MPPHCKKACKFKNKNYEIQIVNRMRPRPSVSFFGFELDLALRTTSSVSLSDGNLYPKMGAHFLFVPTIIPTFVGNNQ